MLSNVHEYAACECYKGQPSSNSGKPSFITEVVHPPNYQYRHNTLQSTRPSTPLPYISTYYTRLGRLSTKALKPMLVFQWELTEVEVHSQMKLYLGVATLVAAAAFIPVIAGLTCASSGCAVCFKNNDSNTKTKFSCPNGNCGDACPIQYQGIQCTGMEGCR